ncbi:MAG: S1 RNA-binding domain-containing protein [Candidatus Nanohaloarchaea archaeon]
MEWYKDRPDEGDFVVVEITDVDKNSAYADLEEYDDIRGLIHISEASRSWVQDLTKELSEGEKTVAQVVDTEDTIGLSLKRVNNNQKRETMERWRKEQKAEDFIGDLEEKIDVDSIYEDVVFPLQEELGSSFQGFEISIAEEERLKKFLDDEVVEAIQEVARENIDLKQEKFEGKLDVEFYQGDGLERIKEAFEEPGEGVEVKCISAPNYSIEAWGRTQELAKKRMDDAVEKIRSKVEELDGEFEFSKA